MRSIIFVSGVLASVLTSRCASEGDAALGDRIAVYVTRGQSPLRMSELTDFTWDRLYIFTPYSSWNSVETDLGFSWPQGRALHLEEREDICLLAFVAEKQVVRYVGQNRARGDFGSLYRKEGYTREEAIFRIDRAQGKPQISVQPNNEMQRTRPAQAMEPRR
jgi:hypothetical protein